MAIRVELREHGTDELLETSLCGTQQAAEALGAVLVAREKGKAYASITTVAQAVECASCNHDATTTDGDGDPACDAHSVSEEQVEALLSEAAWAGDEAMVVHCRRALDGGSLDAIRACREAIGRARVAAGRQ